MPFQLAVVVWYLEKVGGSNSEHFSSSLSLKLQYHIFELFLVDFNNWIVYQ